MKYINLDEDKGKKIFYFILFEHGDRWVRLVLEETAKVASSSF